MNTRNWIILAVVVLVLLIGYFVWPRAEAPTTIEAPATTEQPAE